MATKDITVRQTGERNLTELIRVAVPERSIRADLRAVSIVWRRELIRFRTDRLRAITSLVQPVLFLFVLGTGLSRLASRGLPAGVDFRTFIYPGVLAMSVMFTAIFSAASIVWDREFGFLREMLVAPVRRGSILVRNPEAMRNRSCRCNEAVKAHFEEVLRGVYPDPEKGN